MPEVVREIPQRELRNHIGRVLREVESGARYRVTVSGRPVAEIGPIDSSRWFMSKSEIERIIAEAPLDADFQRDIMSAVDDTLDDQ